MVHCLRNGEMDMKKTLVMMSMLAAVCAACEDNDDIRKPTTWVAPECAGDTHVCAEDAKDVVKICSDGHWISHKCKEGTCKNGTCVVAECDSTVNLPVEAQDAEKVAFGLSADRAALKVCEDGRYVVQACERGQIVKKDDASGVAYCSLDSKTCENGAKRCSVDGVPQLCKNHNWENEAECDASLDLVCSGGDCVKKIECRDGMFKCDDSDKNVKYSCVDGRWSKTDCDTGLVCKKEAKDCVDASGLPEVGAACDAETFKPVCKFGEYYECAGGEVDMMACGSDEGLACVVHEGKDACMYVNSTGLNNACKYDGQALTNLFTVSSACRNAKAGIILFIQCYDIDGALYGDVKQASGVCVDSNTKITCSKETKTFITSTCDNDCHYEKDAFSVTSGDRTLKFDDAVCTVTATSEVKEGDPCNSGTFEDYCVNDAAAMTCPGGTAYLKKCNDDQRCKGGLCVAKSDSDVTCPATGYDVCDDDCELQSGETCIDMCKGRGSNICCMDDQRVYCNDPTVPDDKLWDCSDEKLTNGQSISEYCNAKTPGATKGLCADCSDYFYCLTPEDADKAVNTSGSEYFGRNICAEEDDDIFYDCSNETLQDGTLLSVACNNEEPGNSVALCASCNSEDFWCFADNSNVGKSASEVTGVDVCGGSEPTYKTCDQIDIDMAAQGGCVLQNGQKCQDYCKDKGSDLCYISTKDGKILCEDPNAGKNDVIFDCSDNPYDSKGTTYAQYCVSKDATRTKAVCVSCHEGTFWCLDEATAQSAIGKTATELNFTAAMCTESGATCDLYDCTSQVDISQCPAGMDVALCDSEGGYCAKRHASEDSKCTDGAVAYDFVMDDAGNIDVDCVVVGENASCLSGGSDPAQETFFDCSSVTADNGKSLADNCKASNSKTDAAVCVPCHSDKYWCLPSASLSQVVGKTATEVGQTDAQCSGSSSSGKEDQVAMNSCNLDLSTITVFGACDEANANCEAHLCWEDTDPRWPGFYTDYVVCAKGEDNTYKWYSATGTYKECNNVCAADASDCDSQGGTISNYQ